MVPNKIRTVFTWVISVLLAAVFLASGVPKLLGLAAWIDKFAAWGYSRWFLLLVGTVEVLGAVILLIPRFAKFAAAALILVMLGAAYTHVASAEGLQVARPLVVLVLLAFIFWQRNSSEADVRSSRARPSDVVPPAS